MTTEQIVRFMGKAYKVVPDTPEVYSSCMACAFKDDQNHGCALEDWDAEGDVAPTDDCIGGRHYYVEVMS